MVSGCLDEHITPCPDGLLCRLYDSPTFSPAEHCYASGKNYRETARTSKDIQVRRFELKDHFVDTCRDFDRLKHSVCS